MLERKHPQVLVPHNLRVEAHVDGGRRLLVKPQPEEEHVLASSTKVNQRDPSSQSTNLLLHLGHQELREATSLVVSGTAAAAFARYSSNN